MKRLLAAALLVAALPAFSQQGGWSDISSSWREIQNPPVTFSIIPTPAGCVATSVPIFLGSPVALGCDSGLTYDAANDILAVPNVRAAADDFRLGTAGADRVKVNSTGVTIDDASQYKFNNQALWGGAADLGLARSAAGVLKVTDGGAGAGKILVADGTATSKGIGFATDDDAGIHRETTAGYEGLGYGTGSVGMLHIFVSGAGGVTQLGAITNGGFVARSDGGYRWSSTSDLSSAADTYLTRAAAATLQLGAAPNATPVANTLTIGESGSGTNIAGGNGVIQPGAGTGSGAGSTLTFKTPTPGASGETAQTQGTRLEISRYWSTFSTTPVASGTDAYNLGDVAATWANLYLSRGTFGSKSKTLTDATPTAFATIALADGGETGGKLIYRVVATDGGTARQVVSGSINYAAVHVGATYAVDYDEIQQSTAVSTGTLTGAVTAAAASNLLTFSANFDTDLGTPVLTIYYRFDSTDTLAITPL